MFEQSFAHSRARVLFYRWLAVLGAAFLLIAWRIQPETVSVDRIAPSCPPAKIVRV